MLYVFDLDNTLITSYAQTPGRDFNNWSLMPGAKALVQNLLATGHEIAIATNQAEVAFGRVKEAEVISKLIKVISDLNLPAHTACYYDITHPGSNTHPDTGRRLPSSQMLIEAMNAHGYSPWQTIWVCDYEPHQLAAERANCDLMQIKEFSQAA